ncbi:MAG: hypothetical protein WD097_06395 [Balneolales bacterium]
MYGPFLYLLLFSLLHIPVLRAQDGITVENAFEHLSFSSPIDFQLAPGVPDTIFIAERAGTIQRFRNGPGTSNLKYSICSAGLSLLLSTKIWLRVSMKSLSMHPDYHQDPISTG